jgi:hypothetical protein
MENYLEIGLILGFITAVVFLFLTLRNRWFSDVIDGIYKWWDGELTSDVLADAFALFLVFILVVLVTSLTYILILPLIVVYYIIKRIRRKHIQTLNKDKEHQSSMGEYWDNEKLNK